MVVTIHITGLDKVQGMLNGLRRTIPKAVDSGLKKVAVRTITDLHSSAIKAGIKPWGGGKAPSIFGAGTQFKKKGRRYIVTMDKHGIMLDEMRNHWVALKRGRDITRWALAKGLAISRGRGARPGVTLYPFSTTSIYVRRKPFINRAMKKTNKDAKKIVEKEINKAIRRKGKR